MWCVGCRRCKQRVVSCFCVCEYMNSPLSPYYLSEGRVGEPREPPKRMVLCLPPPPPRNKISVVKGFRLLSFGFDWAALLTQSGLGGRLLWYSIWQIPHIYYSNSFKTLITGTARSIVFARSNNGIVGSSRTRGVDVCVYSVFVLSCVVSGLATGWSPVQWVCEVRIKFIIS
jgi:hypothetical protein